MIAIAGILGTILALPVGVLLARGQRVPVVLGGLPGGVVLSGAVVQVAVTRRLDGLVELPVPQMEPVLAGRLASVEEALVGLAVAVAVPALIVLVGAAVGALRSPVRRRAPALLGALLVFTWSGGFFRDLVLVHPGAQSAGVLLGMVLGGLATVALLGSEHDSNGPEAAGAAGLAYLTVLVGVAVGFRASEAVDVYQHLVRAEPQQALPLFARGQGLLLLLEGRAWSTVAWGAGFALLGLGVAAAPIGTRRLWAGFGAASIPIALGVLPLTATHPAWHAMLRLRAERQQLPAGLLLVEVPASSPLPLASTVAVSSHGLQLDGVSLVDPTDLGRMLGGPSTHTLVLAPDGAVPLTTLFTLAEVAQAAGTHGLFARIRRPDTSDGVLPLVLDRVPDPVPALDGHELYPLRLHLLPGEVHLYVRDQRIELDCLDVCEEPGFATTVLQQLAEAEPSERELLIVTSTDRVWQDTAFWLVHDTGAVLPTRILGSEAWVPADEAPAGP